MTLLSLPYITEETGFRGAIYMTEPTLHFGRLFMEETIEFLEQVCSLDSPKKTFEYVILYGFEVIRRVYFYFIVCSTEPAEGL